MKNMTLRKVLFVTMAASLLVGCGKEQAVVANNETANVDTSVEEESNITSPVLKAMDAYDSVISGLQPGQAYAFADMCDTYDALLVTDYTYDNLDGNIAAIDATIYGLDNDNNVIELGRVTSEGTAYPLAIYESYLMFGGNHHMGMEFISGGNITTKYDATEVFDTDGNATYYLFDLDNEFEGEVEDNSKLTELYDMYFNATILNFTVVE